MEDLKEFDVIIVGAGITGLILSLLLNKLEIKHLILEKKVQSSSSNNAILLNYINLKLLTSLGLSKYTSKLDKISKYDFYNNFIKLPHSVFLNKPQYLFKQAELYEELIRSVSNNNVVIKYETDILSLAQEEKCISVMVKNNIVQQILKAKLIIGCDGENSIIKKLGNFKIINLLESNIFVAEGNIEKNLDLETRVNFFINKNDCSSLIKISKKAYRIGGIVKKFSENNLFEKLNCININKSEFKINKYFNLNIHEYLAEQFFDKRIIIVGGAAHKILPFGGQSLNIAIQDVLGLFWRVNEILVNNKDINEVLLNFSNERKLYFEQAYKAAKFNAVFNCINTEFKNIKIVFDKVSLSLSHEKYKLINSSDNSDIIGQSVYSVIEDHSFPLKETILYNSLYSNEINSKVLPSNVVSIKIRADNIISSVSYLN